MSSSSVGKCNNHSVSPNARNAHLSQVCGHCKRLKRKCDRKQPRCSRCSVNGLECQYDQLKRRPGPAKGAIQSRTSFLLDKVHYLEQTLQTLIRVDKSPPPSLSPLQNKNHVMTMQEDQWQAFISELEYRGPPNLNLTSQDDAQRANNDHQKYSPAPDSRVSSPSFYSSIDCPTDLQSQQGTLSVTAVKEKDILLRLYFKHIQTAFPMFRESVFYEELSANEIPSTLLLAMFAVASRFTESSCFPMQQQTYFQAAYEQFRRQMDENRPVELNDVKTACLLALYDYTTAPSRRAWLLVRDTVSLALSARLHEIDSPDYPLTLSDADQEERRFVWWTVWKLDSTVSVATVMPFGIDCRMIGSALVSTTVKNFTINALERTVSVIPEMDPVKSWASMLAINLQETGDGFNTHIYAVSLLRAVSECQQRLNARLCPEEIAKADSLNQILSSVHLVLPDHFINPKRRPAEEEHTHRLRLETIIMLNTARLILHEPAKQFSAGMGDLMDSTSVSLKGWKENIGFTEMIASVFDHWQFSYSAYADPVISCALWHAYCGLRLYGMSALDASVSSFPSSTVVLEKLRLSLESFTPWWPIARMLRDSIQDFSTKSWVSIDNGRLVSLIAHSRKAFNPHRKHAEKIDIASLLS